MMADKNILRRRKDSTVGLIRIGRPMFMSSEKKSLHYALNLSHLLGKGMGERRSGLKARGDL